MVAGRPRTPIEKAAMLAKGDGRTPGGRKVVDSGKQVVVQGSIVPNAQAFDHALLPETPANLGKRGETEWFKLWDNGPWLRPLEDYRQVEFICRAYDDIDAFRATIASEGLIVKGYAGQTVANPLIAEVRKSEQVILKCLSLLGFSPSDRARLGLAEIKRQTGLADLQNRTNGGK
jgi:P27 family predicted phage terminase small subunit